MAKSFRDEMLSETAEALAHELVADEIRSAATTPGVSDKDIAARIISAVANPRGPVMALAQTLPGFSFPLAGTALAHLFGKTKFLDRVLPEMDIPAVRTAREILRQAGPSILIGALAGIRDAAQDIDRDQIKSKLDEVRSDAGTPTGDQKKLLDLVVVSTELPGRFFVPARDSDGNIRHEGDVATGVPIVLSRDWAMIKAAWDRAHKATTRQVGGGKNQPRRTEHVPGEPFPFQILMLTEALAQAGDAVSASDVEAIKAMLAKPKSWGATLSDRAKDMLLALATTRAKKPALKQALLEDFFKDLPGKGDVALIEHLAERMHARIRLDGTLTDDDFDAAVSHIDSFLGGELTFQNRAFRALDRWMSAGTKSGGKLRAWFRGSLYAGLAFLLAQVMIFLTAFWFMLESLLFGMGEYHRNRAIICATVLIVMLFSLRIWQVAFKPLAVGIMKMNPEWLAEFGWRFTGMLLPVYLIAIGMTPGIDTSFTARWIILALAFVGVCVGMLYKAGEVPAMARMLTIRGAQYGWLVIIAIMAFDWLLRLGWHLIGIGAIGKAAKSAWAFLASHQWVASVVLFVCVFVPGVLVARRIAQTRSRSGTTLHIEQDGYFMGGLLAFVLAIVIAVSVPWFGTKKHTMDPLDPTPTSTVTAPRPKRTQKVNVDDGFDCSGLNPEQRRLAGCP